MKIQDDSLTMLIFIVQNMLDYAQIKSGKFRKNITKFDLRTTVQKIINMQKLQAQDKEIYLYAEYSGFNNNFIINSDEQRIA